MAGKGFLLDKNELAGIQEHPEDIAEIKSLIESSDTPFCIPIGRQPRQARPVKQGNLFSPGVLSLYCLDDH